jgi:hypothetical protein
LERNDVSNFEKEAEAGVEKEDSDPTTTLSNESIIVAMTTSYIYG